LRANCRHTKGAGGVERHLSTSASASAANHDAPLIGERATTRGRCATQGGGEHSGVKSGLSGVNYFFGSKK